MARGIHTALAVAAACLSLTSDATETQAIDPVKLGVSCKWPFGCILVCDVTVIQMNPDSSARVERRPDGKVTISINSDGGINRVLKENHRKRPEPRRFVLKSETSCEVRDLPKPSAPN